LVVENDDGPNQYSTKILYDLIYKKIGIPITHDFHHHNYGPQDISQEEALKLACSTWGDIQPMTHMSSPKTLEDTSGKQTAHADYIYEEIKTFGLDFDTEIEAKAKDLAVIRYRNQFKVLKG
jgi:UV DNA damage endonuclease